MQEDFARAWQNVSTEGRQVSPQNLPTCPSLHSRWSSKYRYIPVGGSTRASPVSCDAVVVSVLENTGI